MASLTGNEGETKRHYSNLEPEFREKNGKGGDDWGNVTFTSSSGSSGEGGGGGGKKKKKKKKKKKNGDGGGFSISEKGARAKR